MEGDRCVGGLGKRLKVTWHREARVSVVDGGSSVGGLAKSAASSSCLGRLPNTAASCHASA
jgi:hypothetical protein